MREYAIAAILSLTIVWLLFLVFGIARKEEIARHAVKDTEAQLAALQARQSVLQQNLNDLNTPRGQEAVLRQTYGVAKPGEQVIIVVPSKNAPPPPPLPWWRQVLNWIGV
jgi:cell division protein FtsB